MRDYEALFILKPDIEQEELKGLYQSINDNIKKYSGEIKEVKEWGKRKLAFMTGKYKEGTYYVLRFSMDPNQIALLNADFNLNESIIRSTIGVAGKEKPQAQA